MARDNRQALVAADRKRLREWIEADDGDTTGSSLPACSAQAETLHARIAPDPNEGSDEAREALHPSASLRLPPLG